ncbi:MAG: hypothetical protein KIS96_10865 [Bauldia sp.]|nr:hypothetical protein [Bauldia sp.]
MRAAYWIRERHLAPQPEGEAVAGLSLELHYRDRVCRVAIELTPPLPGRTPEKEAALDELRRLHAALEEILAPRTH